MSAQNNITDYDFQLCFNMDNDAFSECADIETVRILRLLADRIESGSNGGPVMDINGNKVGYYDVNI